MALGREELASRILELSLKSDPDSIIAARGELLRLMHSAPVTPGDDLAGRIRAALAVTGDCYSFLSEIRSKLAAEHYNKVATLMDIGAIGALAGGDLLIGDDFDFGKIATGAAAEALTVLGSLQYIEAWGKEAEALIAQHSVILHEHVALLPLALGRRLPEDRAEETFAALEELFSQIRAENVPQPGRIALMCALYALVCRVHLQGVAQAAKGV